MNLTPEAQDFEQAKASCLLYRIGDSLLVACETDDTQVEPYYANCLANDIVFQGHGKAPYSVYAGKDTNIFP